jgi:4-amino-4-deoxy-L-arabinose transferase-like glycosyltransferase
MIPFFQSWSDSRKIVFLLFSLLFFRLIFALLVPLSPQEAYYWVYSLHPALSYFDHPPLVAYTIFLFTRLLGSTVLAVRFGSLIYSFGFSWLLYLIGKRMFDKQTGIRAALLMNLLPIFAINSLIMTPDSPLVFFWGLCWFFSLRAIQETRYSNYLWAGISLGLALLSKYTAFFLPISILLFLLISPGYRHHLKRMEPYGGLLLALLIFLPVLIWNFQNDWASFVFQSHQRDFGIGETMTFTWKTLVAFLGSQAGILTPLVFIGFCWTIGVGIKQYWQKNPWKETLLLSLALPMVGLFTLVATRDTVKMNWLIPAYPPLLLLMITLYQHRIFTRKRTHQGFAKWTWITVILFFFAFHLLPFVPQIPVSGSADTLTGWSEIAGHLDKILAADNGTSPPFIFSCGHKTAAELQFYLKGHPATYTQTVLGKQVLAYNYWFDPKTLKGKDALFVWSDFEGCPPHKSDLLKNYFQRIEDLEPFQVFRGKKPFRTFHIYRCYGYKGIELK